MHIHETAPREFARHRSAIEALARNAAVDAAYVKELYERELNELQAHAKVRDFLPVLVAGAVRRRLNRARTRPA